jgi:hypothetical protein
MDFIVVISFRSITPVIGSVFKHGDGRQNVAVGDMKSHQSTRSGIYDRSPVQVCREYQSRQVSIL